MDLQCLPPVSQPAGVAIVSLAAGWVQMQDLQMRLSGRLSFRKVLGNHKIVNCVQLASVTGIRLAVPGFFFVTGARRAGRRLVRINLSEQTDMMDLLGADLPAAGGAAGQFAWADGPLLGALQAGSWVLLDELNLASAPCQGLCGLCVRALWAAAGRAAGGGLGAAGRAQPGQCVPCQGSKGY